MPQRPVFVGSSSNDDRLFWRVPKFTLIITLSHTVLLGLLLFLDFLDFGMGQRRIVCCH
jgi:hypothetical protein